MNKNLRVQQDKYCQLRANGRTPTEAHREAGYLYTRSAPQVIRDWERDSRFMERIAFYRREAQEIKTARPTIDLAPQLETLQKNIAKLEAEKAAGVPAKLRAKDLKKEDISQALLDLALKAETYKDWGTARACYNDLGRELFNMFNPTKTVRIERIEDLTLEQAEAVLQKLDLAIAESDPPPEDANPELAVN